MGARSQALLFSATVSPAIQKVAAATLHGTHEYLSTVSDAELATHAAVPQRYTLAPQRAHFALLAAQLAAGAAHGMKAIVFLPTAREAEQRALLRRQVGRQRHPAEPVAIGAGLVVGEVEQQRVGSRRQCRHLRRLWAVRVEPVERRAGEARRHATMRTGTPLPAGVFESSSWYQSGTSGFVSG